MSKFKVGDVIRINNKVMSFGRDKLVGMKGVIMHQSKSDYDYFKVMLEDGTTRMVLGHEISPIDDDDTQV